MCVGLGTSALPCGAARAARSLQLRLGAASCSLGTCMPVFQSRLTPASAVERAQLEFLNFGVRILLLPGAGWGLEPSPGRERSGAERIVGAGFRSSKFTAGAPNAPPCPARRSSAEVAGPAPGTACAAQPPESEAIHSLLPLSQTWTLTQTGPDSVFKKSRWNLQGELLVECSGWERAPSRETTQNFGVRLRSDFLRQWSLRVNP